MTGIRQTRSQTMGVGLFPTETPRRIVDLASLAEESGYETAWFGDSQSIWREVYVTMGAAAMATSTIRLGTGVSQVVTRHLAVTASAWATLDELTGGRALCGLGTGDSSLRTVGLQPMKLAQLERAVGNLRALWRGEDVADDTGNNHRLAYRQDTSRIPIHIAASAPKIIELSGRIADGVILLVGTNPDFVAAALDTLEKGAKATGRTLDDIHITLWIPTAIEPDGNTARELVRAHVARALARPLPFDLPAGTAEAVAEVQRSYNYYEHLKPGAHHGESVPDTLIPLFAFAGDMTECADQLVELAQLPVDQLAIVPFAPPGGDRAETISRFAQLMRG